MTVAERASTQGRECAPAACGISQTKKQAQFNLGRWHRDLADSEISPGTVWREEGLWEGGSGLGDLN